MGTDWLLVMLALTAAIFPLGVAWFILTWEPKRERSESSEEREK